jgi:hypothetical protein
MRCAGDRGVARQGWRSREIDPRNDVAGIEPSGIEATGIEATGDEAMVRDALGDQGSDFYFSGNHAIQSEYVGRRESFYRFDRMRQESRF